MPVQDASQVRADLRTVSQSIDAAETQCKPAATDAAACAEALEQVGDGFRRFTTDYRRLAPEERASLRGEAQTAVDGEQLRTYKLLDLMRVGGGDARTGQAALATFGSATAAGVAVRPGDFQASLDALGQATAAGRTALATGDGLSVALARLEVQLNLTRESFAALDPQAQAGIRGQYDRKLLDIGHVVTSDEAVNVVKTDGSAGETIATVARTARLELEKPR